MTELQTITNDNMQLLLKRNPNEETNEASAWSQQLMNIINTTLGPNGKPTMADTIQGNQYINVEGWQMIAKYAGLYVETVDVTPEYEKEELIGYKATVILVNKDTGIKAGGATSLCGMTENTVIGQKNDGSKRNACMSMAQTRATSRAIRSNFGFVAKMAGYQATPAEEMVNLETNPVQTITTKPKPQPIPQPTPPPQPQYQGATTIEHKGMSADIPIQIDDSAIDCPLHVGEVSTKKTNKSSGDAFWSHSNGNGWCSINNFNALTVRDDVLQAWQQQLLNTTGTDHNILIECSNKTIQEVLVFLEHARNTESELCIVCGNNASVLLNDDWLCVPHAENVGG
jgi:hypothetical protein